MKKALWMVLVVILVCLSFVACNPNGQKQENIDPTDPTTATSRWTACNKTVYGIAATYFYVSPDSASVCGTSKVGYAIPVVATDGEWYEVDSSNRYTNCPAYIKCSDVTENASVAAFVNVPESCYPDATVNYYRGAYLRSDISGSEKSKVGFIQSGYITVEVMNEAKTWVQIRFDGTDSEGRTYDSSKLYYCLASELEIVGLPDNWP